MTTKIQFILSRDAAGGQVTDPRDHLAGSGPGGSRAGFCGLVRAMGRRGDYDVTAISTFVREEEVVDGVRYLRWDAQGDEWGEADVCFAYYDVRELLRFPHREGRLRIGSHHTLRPYEAWPRIDVHTAPCQWACDFLKRGYRPLGKWEVLPNAVEGLDHVEWRPVPGRVIYQTSPDRGLHNLLLLWPEIRRRVPHATLHVTGTPELMARTFMQAEWAGSDEERMARQLADGIVAAQRAGGVEFLGRVTRDRMLRELSEASCFAFPGECFSPCETFSVSILEAMVIGVPVVLSPVDALASVWGSAAVMCLPASERFWRSDFVDHVVRVLGDRHFSQRVSERQREYASHFTFDAAAAALDQMIRKHRAPEAEIVNRSGPPPPVYHYAIPEEP